MKLLCLLSVLDHMFGASVNISIHATRVFIRCYQCVWQRSVLKAAEDLIYTLFRGFRLSLHPIDIPLYSNSRPLVYTLCCDYPLVRAPYWANKLSDLCICVSSGGVVTGDSVQTTCQLRGMHLDRCWSAAMNGCRRVKSETDHQKQTICNWTFSLHLPTATSLHKYAQPARRNHEVVYSCAVVP